VPRQTPTIHRWQLGQQLRRLREEAGISLHRAALEIETSNATMSKIESGKQAARPVYVKLLASMYGVDISARQRLVELAGEAGQSEWFASLAKHIPDWFKLYLGYETAAHERRGYSAELIDGLLQTPEYARAVAAANRPRLDEDELGSKVGIRKRRQQRLAGDDPLTLHSIINEAALCRVVGCPEVMRAQLRHVIGLAELPNVTVQVLPFSAGVHPAMTAPFVLLGFQDHPGMDTVYLENGRGALYLEAESDLDRYNWVFDQVRGLALSPAKSRTLLATVVKQL
jgi:transcriptional regulator with XRE-family HTH domain